MHRLFLFSLAILLPTGLFAADAIYRENDKTLQGTIIGSTKTEITLQQGNKEEKVPVNVVQRITWDKEPAAIKNARSRELAGNLKQALELYNQVKADSAGFSAEAKTDLDYLMVRTQARQAILDPAQADAAIAALEQFKSAHPNNFRFYDLQEFLGRVYAAKGDLDKAKAAYAMLGEAPYGDLKMAAKLLTAEALFNASDVPGAQAEYAAVVGMSATSPQEKNRQNEGRLGQANCLTKLGKGAESLELCNQVIAETSVEQPSVQATAFLRKGDALASIEKNQQAVLAYLAVDLLFENQPALHAEALHKLSDLWGKVGKGDRASDAKARLQRQYPESRWLSQAG